MFFDLWTFYPDPFAPVMLDPDKHLRHLIPDTQPVWGHSICPIDPQIKETSTGPTYKVIVTMLN